MARSRRLGGVVGSYSDTVVVIHTIFQSRQCAVLWLQPQQRGHDDG
ncbi:hypothetical protein [Synechococcus sp. NOUM97013]|nr:hypothetical protein [Synechococcus sp. NOUM97013]